MKLFPFLQTILDSCEISSKSVWSRKNSCFRQKKILLLIKLVSGVPSFYIHTKFILKNRVTTVWKQIFWFICPFEGEICCKLKNNHFDNFSLISKKILDSLNSSSDSFTFVYIRLNSSSGSSVFLEQIKKVSFIQNKYIRFYIMLDNRRHILWESWIVWQSMKGTCEVQNSSTLKLVDAYVPRY